MNQVKVTLMGTDAISLQDVNLNMYEIANNAFSQLIDDGNIDDGNVEKQFIVLNKTNQGTYIEVVWGDDLQNIDVFLVSNIEE